MIAGNKGPFIISTLSGGIAIILLLFFKDNKSGTEIPAEFSPTVSFKDALKVKNLLPYAFLQLIAMYLIFATNLYFTPLYAEQVLQATKPQIGHIATVYTLCVILAGVTGPWIENKLGAKRVLFLSFVLSAICAFSIYFIKNINMLMFLQGGIGYSAAMVQIVFVACIIRYVGNKYASLSLGIFYCISSLGQILGPGITGFLWESNANFLFIFSGISSIAVIAAIILLFLSYPKEQKIKG